MLYTSALPQLLIEKDNSEGILQHKKHTDAVIIQLSHFQLINTNSQGNYLGNELDFLSELWAEFKIRTQRPGWIAFELSKKGIANWLQQIQIQSMANKKNHTFIISKPSLATDQITTPPSSLQQLLIEGLGHRQMNQTAHPTVNHDQAKPQTDEINAWLWQTQYTHARCHSLLRCWQMSHTAQLSHTDKWPGESLQQSLRQLPEGRRLIHALIDTYDAMFWIPYRYPTNQYFLLLKCANQLCQAFEAFYRTQLAGFAQFLSVSSEPADSQLLQARFGLVIATQKALESLLEQHLGAVAPEHL